MGLRQGFMRRVSASVPVYRAEDYEERDGFARLKRGAKPTTWKLVLDCGHTRMVPVRIGDSKDLGPNVRTARCEPWCARKRFTVIPARPWPHERGKYAHLDALRPRYPFRGFVAQRPAFRPIATT